jgi:hypothetical protein
MAGVIGLGGCCTCGATPCGTPRNWTITVSCEGVVSGATVTLYDASNNVEDTCTTNVSGVCTVQVPYAGDWRVEATKSGYTVAEVTRTFTCASTFSNTLDICQTSVTFRVIVNVCCPLAGATVDISGGFTDTGTTDSSGEIIFTFAKPSGSCADVSITISVTPPTGHGAASTSQSGTVTFCPGIGENYTEFNLSPDSTHAPVCVNGGVKYLPKTLDYDDELGACTLTYGGLGPSGHYWTGSYTYTTACGAETRNCGGGVFKCLLVSGTATATVTCNYINPGTLCGNPTLDVIWTAVRANAYADCAASGTQPAISIGDALCDTGTFVRADEVVSIGGSSGTINIASIALLKFATYSTCVDAEIEQTASITGTV